MRRSISFLGSLLLGILMASPHAAAQDIYEGDWKDFRAQYQFHIQTIAVSRPHEGGSRSLIIAEPPPHVTLDGLRQIDPLLSDPRVMQQFVGHDGWVKDVLFKLPALSGRELDALAIKLNRYLFFTAYKTSALLISPGVGRTAEKLPLDLRVSAAQLRSWTSSRAAKFVPLLGGAPQGLAEILHGKVGGVFLSSSPGLVLWAFPSEGDLASRRIEAREFAVDSDLMLGAISSGPMVAVIARERIVPCDVVPPLRAETIFLLASANTDELAQSYERTHFAAGKYDLKQNADWAPIFLSDELIDTEYGSLLNITDQLLKSWSLNGTVWYERFRYPDPPKWAFPKPLIDVLDVPELTFNWNTTGAGYSAEGGEFTTLALNRTGALPVSYIPEGQPDDPRLEAMVAAKEGTAYSYFAQMNDPNLVRVVQYASLYQIFRRFNVTAVAPPGVHAAPAEALTNQVMTQLDAFPELTEDKVKSNLQGLIDRHELSEIEALSVLQSLDHFKELQEILGKAIQRWGPSGLRQLSEIVVNPRVSSGELKEALQRLITVAGPMPVSRLKETVRGTLSAPTIMAALSDPASLVSRLQPEDQRVLAFHALARDINRNKSLIRALTGTSVAALMKIYEENQRRPVSSWIHTPSIVVSYTKEKAASGGHNLDPRVTKFRESSSVPRRTVRVIGDRDERVVLYNPADEYFPRELTPYAARNGKRLSNNDLQKLLTAHIPPPPPPPPARNLALGFSENFKPRAGRGLQTELTASRTPPIGFGTIEADLTPAQSEFIRAVQGENRTGTVVERRSANSILIYHTTTGQIVEATDMSGAVDAIGEIAISEKLQGRDPAFFFRNGFSVDEAESMGLSARMNADADLVVEVNPSTVAEMRSLAEEGALNVKATELSNPELITGEGRSGVEITAKTPFRSGISSFVWKVRVFFRSMTEPITAMAGRVRLAVQNVIARCDANWSMIRISREANRELKRHFGSDVRVVIHQTQDVVITELREASASAA